MDYDNLIKSWKGIKEQLEKDAADPKLAPKDVKVKQLQAKIDAGKYKPDSKKIAGKMVERGVFSKSGQWSIEKSNYGPKGMGQYKDTDNIKRKKTRTSEEVDAAGSNKAVRQYTTSGSVMTDERNRKLQAQNKKQPVTRPQLSPEEKAQIEARMNAKNKKAASEDGVEKITGYGQGSAGFGMAMSDKDKR